MTTPHDQGQQEPERAGEDQAEKRLRQELEEEERERTPPEPDPDDVVDVASTESMDASDPPSYTATITASDPAVTDDTPPTTP